MSKPLKSELDVLRECLGDDEAYHAAFDRLIEQKLMSLDPQWMTAMQKVYDESGMSRWCA